MITIIDKSKCCGCTACFSICPKHCVEMKMDEEGFFYPFVNGNIWYHYKDIFPFTKCK